MKAALVVAVLALLAASCGGGTHTTSTEETLPTATTPRPVPATHAVAMRYVKTCRAALAKTPIRILTRRRAPVAKREVAKAIVACNSTDRLYALTNRNRADPIVYGAYLGFAAISYGLGNFQKYATAIAAGKTGVENVLGLAQEQIASGKQRLEEAVVALPYPP